MGAHGWLIAMAERSLLLCFSSPWLLVNNACACLDIYWDASRFSFFLSFFHDVVLRTAGPLQTACGITQRESASIVGPREMTGDDAVVFECSFS